MPPPREAQKIQVQLEADAPNSHVTFRRRVAAAPSTVTISATDVVELVEVSAPGYKTARFWLTFDRPTHLHAHLQRGNGLLEATEEETLVALGEVSAPAIATVAKATEPTKVAVKAEPIKAEPAKAEPAKIEAKVEPKPAQVAAVKAAPTTTTTTTPPQQVAMAPRKIGKAAAEKPAEQPQAMAPDLPSMAAMPEDKTDAAKLPKTEPAKTEPAKLADAPITKVEPVPVPAIAKPAIDNATVTSVVGSHRPEVLKCFAEGKKKDHGLKGTVSLQMQVDAAGKVHHIQVQSSLKDPLVAACVVKSANGWRFPSRSNDGEMATVNYPFTIN
jgi:hypothetical protein